MSVTDTLTRKAGPLPVWAWGAIGGGALVLVRSLAGGQRAPSGPVILSPATTAAPTVSSPLGGLGSLLGGLATFLCSIPNAPNDLDVTLADGSRIAFSNGIPTYGSTATFGRGDEWGAGEAWNPCRPEPPAASSPPGGPPGVVTEPPPDEPPGPTSCPPGQRWDIRTGRCVPVLTLINPFPPGLALEPRPEPPPAPVAIVPGSGWGWPAWFTQRFPWLARGGTPGPGGWTWYGTGGQPYQPGQLA